MWRLLGFCYDWFGVWLSGYWLRKEGLMFVIMFVGRERFCRVKIWCDCGMEEMGRLGGGERFFLWILFIRRSFGWDVGGIV